MDMDLASLHKILKDSTRRNIVLHLNTRGQLGYMELMNLLEITNTGKFNYHLKALGDLIEKSDDGKYRLTERGQLASQLLRKFPEKSIETKTLGVGDAVLIGLVGFLFLLPALFLPVFIFLLTVSGVVMWWLTERRTKSHDFYVLLRPPLVLLMLLMVLVVLMLLLNLSFQPVPYNGGYVQQTMIGLLGVGFIPFVGVMIAEYLHRLLERS